VETEEADDEVSNSHATYSIERVLDVRRSKQTKNEHHSIFGVTEAELDHVEKPAENNMAYLRQHQHHR